MNEQPSPMLLRRSQRRIPAFRPAALGSRTLIVIVAVAGVLALIVGFSVRAPLERALVLGSVRGATGLRIDAAGVERIDGGYELTRLEASTPGGAISLSAARAYLVPNERDIRITLFEPHVAFAPDRMRGDEARNVAESIGRSSYARSPLTILVNGGSAVVVRGDVPQALLALDGVRGSLAFVAGHLLARGTAQLDAGDRGYPVTLSSAADAAGNVTSEVSAPELPLGPLAATLPDAGDARIVSGTLRDVDVRDGESLAASMTLDRVDVALGTHDLAGLSGPLAFAENGVGSKGLTGTIGGIPLTVAGEVHDLGPHFGFIANGSNDLSNLVKLLESLASEPAVTSIAVEAEAPGLAYGQYGMTTDHGPLAVSVLAIDPHERSLRFDTAIAEDRVISGGERTSAMGVRTGAVGGINGDYFDIGRTYQPQGMLVRAGRLIRGPVNRAALAIDRDNHVTFGEFQLTGSAQIGAVRYPITQVNDWPAGKVTVITPEFGKLLPASPGTSFARLAPGGSAGRFRVASVEPCTQAFPVSFGLAFGPGVTPLPHAGQRVELHYDTDPSIRNVVAAIGGGPILVRDGLPFEDPDAPAPDERNYRWPVDALAETNAGHLMLVAVDGRHPERSVGMMRPEFTELLLRLGARNAMALDSGGSVTLVSRAVGAANVSVRNVPSDNSAERWISDALFLYSSAPAASIVPVASAPTPAPEERPSP